MARNRVIYQSEGLYVSKDASLTGAIDHDQLNRVQSANYSFTINRQDVNQFVDLARIDSLVLEPPTVSLDFSYYLTDGFNERALGFFVETTGTAMNRGGAGTPNGEANFASGHLTSSSGVNFYILTSPDGVDLNQAGTGVALDTDDHTIGIGNCYVSDYSVELAVGSLATVNLTVEGANMNSTLSAASGAIVSPAINQELGTPWTANKVALPNPTQDGGITGGTGEAPITALRPGDVTLDLGGLGGTSLVNISGAEGAHIQSASISLPLSRSPIDELGKLRVDISVITERLEGSIKLAGEAYFSELYSLLVDKLGLEDWKESIAKKLSIIKDIRSVFQQKIDAAREDLLSVLIIILIFIELVIGLLHYLK